MAMKLRPFEEYMERESGAPMLEFRGEIAGNVFVVSVLGQRVPLDTTEVGTDKHGPFALVSECSRELRDGFKLAVELEPDEDGFHGTVLRLFAENETARREAESRIRARGMEPDRVQLIGFVERSFGVHVDHWGKVNGRSSMSKDSPDRKPERPS